MHAPGMEAGWKAEGRGDYCSKDSRREHASQPVMRSAWCGTQQDSNWRRQPLGSPAKQTLNDLLVCSCRAI